MASSVATLAVPVGGAIVYSLSTFFSKRAGKDPEKFNYRKFLRAIVIGVVVGVVALSQGVELTPSSFEQLAGSSGVVAVADQITKLLWRLVQRVRERAGS